MTSLKFGRSADKDVPPRVFHIAVVGVSGSEASSTSDSSKDSHLRTTSDYVGADAGPGKSCLCNRFVRPAEDEFLPLEHVSVLSAADYSTPAINNDHFLYWGCTKRISDDGTECTFSIVEQTEFIDDSNFQAFRNGKGDKDYVRRATSLKLNSPGKIQYYQKSQLGIENEWPENLMPDGKFIVDGFICTFDVSPSRRPIQRQVDIVFQLLCQIVRQKKPCVLVATKMDESITAYLGEALRLLQRKELKGCVQLVETSARLNVNVDAAFVLLAQLIERTGNASTAVRCKLPAYHEAESMRKERMETASKAYEALVKNRVKDRRMTWSEALRLFSTDQDFKFYCELWGTASAQKIFNAFMRQLRDREAKSRLSIYLSRLDRIFHELLPNSSLTNRGWRACLEYLQSHPSYGTYFADLQSADYSTSSFLDDDRFSDTSSGDGRVPSRILLTQDAEKCFNSYAESVRRDEKRMRLRSMFSQLLQDTPYALPGRSLRDTCVFLASETAYTEELNELSSFDKEEIYEAHQKKIIEAVKEDFLELLMENISLFLQKNDRKLSRKKRDLQLHRRADKNEDDLREISEALRSDHRYRAMDLIASQRMAMMQKLFNYFTSSVSEICWSHLGCWDTVSRDYIAESVGRIETLPAFSRMRRLSDSVIRVALISTPEPGEGIVNVIAARLGNQITLNGAIFHLDIQHLNDDVTENPFEIMNGFHGCICIYDSKGAFHFVKNTLERIDEERSSRRGEDRPLLPGEGLPLLVIFEPNETLKEAEVSRLRECGQDLVTSMQCPFLEISRVVKPLMGDNHQIPHPTGQVKESAIASHLRLLVGDIQERSVTADGLANGTTPPSLFDGTLRIRMCLMCGDQQAALIRHVVSPLTRQFVCYQSPRKSQAFLLETYISESWTKVRAEIDCVSFHQLLRQLQQKWDPYCNLDSAKAVADGVVLVFSANRKASVQNTFAVMDILAIQNVAQPILIIGVVDSLCGPTEEESAILKEIETLCRDRNAVFFLTNAAADQCVPMSVYSNLMRIAWECKLLMYERASTATLNSTVPSLSDEEAALIKCRSLERNHSASNLKHLAFTNGVFSSGGLDKNDLATFASERNRSIRKRPELVNVVDDTMATPGMSSFSDARSLRTTRSSEDILDGTHNIGHLSTSESSHVSSEDDHNHRGPSRKQRKSVPNEFESRTYDIQPLISRTDRPECATLNRPRTNASKAGSSAHFSRSSSALSVISPEEPKKHIHPLLRGIAAWQARSTEEGEKDHRSSGQRLVGKLANAAGYASFMDRLNAVNNANIARGSQPSPTAPIAMPELVEDNEDVWEERQLGALHSPVSDRHFLIRKRTKDIKPPDRLLKFAGPKLLPSQALSLSYDEESKACTPPRSSLPEFIDKMPNLSAASPLDDNVFFSSPTEDPPARHGGKVQKAISVSKPKREKENRPIKKAKDKKKKLDETFEAYAQSSENPIPLFVQRCVEFIESKGIDSEGVYRISGSRIHADQLLAKYLSNSSSLNLVDLDPPVPNVTTALKTFLSEHIPPVIPQSFVDELHDLNFTKEKSDRIQLIKRALARLSATHFQLLKYIFSHLHRLSEYSKSNKMDASNLTVCLWPTLCPIELPNDMAKFEAIRVRVTEILSTMIAEYHRIFEPNSLLTQNGSPRRMTSLAAEVAEAARQRTRHPSDSEPASTSRGQLAPFLPMSSAHPPADSLGPSGSSSFPAQTKGPMFSGLKSVQV